MKRIIPLIAALALAAPSGVFAQEEAEYERGDLSQVVTWQVSPEHGKKWEATVTQIAEAAKAANLSADYKWAFWSGPSTYTLVYPVKSFAYFDDPMQWIRQFSGTAGEEMLNAAMAEFPNIDHHVLKDEISEHKEDWSYEPAEFNWDGMKHVHVDHFWVKAGKEDEFSGLIKEFMAFFGEFGYAYPIWGHEIHFGDSGRTDFVTGIDDMSAFYGANSLEALISQSGSGERWEGLIQRLNQVITKWDHGNYTYEPEMSYWPEEEVTSN